MLYGGEVIMGETEAVIIDTENVQELRDCTEEVSE